MLCRIMNYPKLEHPVQQKDHLVPLQNHSTLSFNFRVSHIIISLYFFDPFNIDITFRLEYHNLPGYPRLAWQSIRRQCRRSLAANKQTKKGLFWYVRVLVGVFSSSLDNMLGTCWKCNQIFNQLSLQCFLWSNKHYGFNFQLKITVSKVMLKSDFWTKLRV